MSSLTHQPVLLAETLELLAPAPGDVVLDLTAGRGGHAAALAQIVRGDDATPGHVVLFDLDAGNLAAAATRVRETGCAVTAVHDNFARVDRHLREQGRRADIVLADLGFASTQMDDPERGFSFQHDGPLDMRYDRGDTTTRGLASASAARLLATLTEAELADIVREYGEEPLARKIARKLVQARADGPIESTVRLAQLVVEAYGGRARASRVHPATRTFMALRIAVNEELSALRLLLDGIARAAERVDDGGWLRPGARVGIISFHSLEDRLVKRAFADIRARGQGTVLTRQPVTATAQEVQVNPRSRSAKLRAVRISGPGSPGTEAVRDDT
ncbi:MAG: 16S rRNA (cytosine(1402)-N(4))-methyltransferase RsmH [Phycisphaerales bacterium]|nr:16S rRNA (cytosine(1402)-N(4))-methyltransferase RsmH [Phycisphaerales bacterium]